MNNQNYQDMLNGMLNQQSSQNRDKINKISNALNTNQGKNLAQELNKMANNNQNIQNAINQAKVGDINSLASSLSQMMNTKDGQDLANLFSKILGE